MPPISSGISQFGRVICGGGPGTKGGGAPCRGLAWVGVGWATVVMPAVEAPAEPVRTAAASSARAAAALTGRSDAFSAMQRAIRRATAAGTCGFSSSRGVSGSGRPWSTAAARSSALAGAWFASRA